MGHLLWIHTSSISGSLHLSLSLDPGFFHLCYVIIAIHTLRVDKELVMDCIGYFLLCVDIFTDLVGKNVSPRLRRQQMGTETPGPNVKVIASW